MTQETPLNYHNDTPEDLDTSNALIKSFFNNKDLVQMSVDIKSKLDDDEISQERLRQDLTFMQSLSPPKPNYLRKEEKSLDSIQFKDQSQMKLIPMMLYENKQFENFDTP